MSDILSQLGAGCTNLDLRSRRLYVRQKLRFQILLKFSMKILSLIFMDLLSNKYLKFNKSMK